MLRRGKCRVDRVCGDGTVALPVTRQVPNQVVSFVVSGAVSSISTTVRATGAGTLTTRRPTR